VLAGAGRVRHGRGGPGSSAAGEAPARAEGGPGSGVTGEAMARAERVGAGRGRARPGRRQPGGAGRARPRWSGVRRWHEQLVAKAVRITAHGRDARERSGRKKGRDRVYSLMFIEPTPQPTNISRLTYVAAVTTTRRT
jgi:hypothetical protein